MLEMYGFVRDRDADTQHSDDVDNLVDRFNGIVAKLVDGLAPVKQFTIQERHRRLRCDAESRSIRKSMRRLEANTSTASRDARRAALKSSGKRSHAEVKVLLETEAGVMI